MSSSRPKKHWSKTDEKRRLCEAWLAEPLINPTTGMPIERNGPTYKYWQEECKKLGLSSRPVATRAMSWRKCQEWKRHPDINPDTGRKIARGGPTYRNIEKQCQCIEKNVLLEGTYYIPDTRGMVPVIKHADQYYVLREYRGRKIYGPLNAHASRGIQLQYFKDTWDYRRGTYRPVFMGHAEPPRPKQAVTVNQRKNSDPKYMVDKVINLFI